MLRNSDIEFECFEIVEFFCCVERDRLVIGHYLHGSRSGLEGRTAQKGLFISLLLRPYYASLRDLAFVVGDLEETILPHGLAWYGCKFSSKDCVYLTEYRYIDFEIYMNFQV